MKLPGNIKQGQVFTGYGKAFKMTEAKLKKGDHIESMGEIGIVNKVKGQVAYVKFDSNPKSFHPILVSTVKYKGKHKGKDLYTEQLDEGRGKKVSKNMWKKMSDDEKYDALLTVVKDPDDAEEYIGSKWNDLPNGFERDMYTEAELPDEGFSDPDQMREAKVWTLIQGGKGFIKDASGKTTIKLKDALKFKNIKAATKASSTMANAGIPNMVHVMNEAINEAEKYMTNKYKVGDTIKLLKYNWKVTEVNFKPGKSYKDSFTFVDGKQVPIKAPPTNKNAVGYKLEDGSDTAFYHCYKAGSGKTIMKLSVKGFNESVNEAKDNLYLQLHKKYAEQIKGLKAKKIKKLTDLVSVQRWAMEDEYDNSGFDRKAMSKQFNDERKLFKQYMAGDKNVSLKEALAKGLKPLLIIGSKITKKVGEDTLLKLSDKFDRIDDEYAGTIASHLDMAIELMQDGYPGDASKKLKQFNKACKDVLKGKDVGSAFEGINEGQPVFQTTPNELAYIDFKKWAYKNRKTLTNIIKKAIDDGRDPGTSIFLSLRQIWLAWAKKNAKEWSRIPNKDADGSKFGRALAVMMKKDNLIIKKSGNKLTDLVESNSFVDKLKEAVGIWNEPDKLNEMDINDPVLVAMRAWKTQLKKDKSKPPTKKISMNKYYKLMDKESDLIDQMKDASKELARMFSDMNAEAGQKGEDWSDADANRYGGDLDKLQTKYEKLAKQKAKVKKAIMDYRIS